MHVLSYLDIIWFRKHGICNFGKNWIFISLDGFYNFLFSFEKSFTFDWENSEGTDQFKLNLRLLCHHFFLNYQSFRTSKEVQPFTKYLRQTLVFMWNSALREKFNFLSFFSSLLLILTKKIIFGGRLGTKLWFYEILGFSWYFLITLLFTCGEKKIYWSIKMS